MIFQCYGCSNQLYHVGVHLYGFTIKDGSGQWITMFSGYPMLNNIQFNGEYEIQKEKSNREREIQNKMKPYVSVKPTWVWVSERASTQFDAWMVVSDQHYYVILLTNMI